MNIYVPIDLAEELLHEAEQVARALAPLKEVIPIHGDFYRMNRGKGEKILPGNIRAGVMLGATISNMNMMLEEPFPEANIVKKIQSLGSLLTRNSSGKSVLAVSYDSNPDLEGSAFQAYNNDNWSRMIAGIMIDVQNILKPTGYFNPFSWHHERVVNKEKYVIQQCLVADEDQNPIIDGVISTIRKGDAFVIVNNFKYTPELMQSLFNQAGYVPHDPIRIPDNHMVIQTADLN